MSEKNMNEIWKLLMEKFHISCKLIVIGFISDRRHIISEWQVSLLYVLLVHYLTNFKINALCDGITKKKKQTFGLGYKLIFGKCNFLVHEQVWVETM